jgi:hypothetical protein
MKLKLKFFFLIFVSLNAVNILKSEAQSVKNASKYLSKDIIMPTSAIFYTLIFGYMKKISHKLSLNRPMSGSDKRVLEYLLKKIIESNDYNEEAIKVIGNFMRIILMRNVSKPQQPPPKKMMTMIMENVLDSKHKKGPKHMHWRHGR